MNKICALICAIVMGFLIMYTLKSCGSRSCGEIKDEFKACLDNKFENIKDNKCSIEDIFKIVDECKFLVQHD